MHLENIQETLKGKAFEIDFNTFNTIRDVQALINGRFASENDIPTITIYDSSTYRVVIYFELRRGLLLGQL